jgi:hypothetical protein
LKLAAIFNVWDDYDLLKYAVENMRPLVEGIIVIYSNTSNYGEISQIPDCALPGYVTGYNFEPNLNLSPMVNETTKRNFGIQKAREAGYTHFLIADSDEFYEKQPFLHAKNSFRTDLSGLVVRSQVYFASPKLTIGLDTTLVPFIHKMTPTIKCEFNRKYPFAWENVRTIRIDPTRSYNITTGVEMNEEVIMHHLSWIRKDYEKKIRNSTARDNIKVSTIMKDLLQAKEGQMCEFYHKQLVASTVDFGIPDNVFQSFHKPTS